MDIRKILKPIKNLFSKSWKRWTILAILAMVVYIGFILYQFIYKPVYQFREPTSQRLEINKNHYQKIMETYSKSSDIINDLVNRSYPDPFK